MSEQRASRITIVSVMVAVVSAGWAVYATKHAGKPGGGAGPPMMGAPAGGAAKPSRGAPGPGRGGPPGAAGFGGGPVPVVTAPVRSVELTRKLAAVGTARANEAVDVTSKSSNIVTRVRFGDGQVVRQGEVLVELDSAQARADLAAAQAAVTESDSQYQRALELLNTQALSKSQFDQLLATKQANEARLAAARARLEDTVIRAPFTGRVGLRRVSVGSLISPGTTIASLDDSSAIKLDFTVPENVVGSLREGLEVRASSTAWPDRAFTGAVQSIDSRVDPTSRSVAVRALLPNNDGALRPGMFLTVELQSERRTALVVPEEALVPEQSKQYVYVVDKGVAARREVTIGARQPGSVEVLAGVTLGERIVVEGTIRVRDGGKVQEGSPGEPAAAGPGNGAGPGAAGQSRGAP